MRAACDAGGLALVPLVAPTTPDERLARIGARRRGFVYTVSVTGTTGERAALADALRRRRRARAKAPTDVPVAVGFGIAHARAGGARRPTRAPTASSSAAAWCAPPPRRPTTRARPRPCATWSPAFAAGPEIAFCPDMGLVVATTVGLVVWIVLWAHRRQGRSMRS